MGVGLFVIWLTEAGQYNWYYAIGGIICLILPAIIKSNKSVEREFMKH